MGRGLENACAFGPRGSREQMDMRVSIERRASSDIRDLMDMRTSIDMKVLPEVRNPIDMMALIGIWS